MPAGGQPRGGMARPRSPRARRQAARNFDLRGGGLVGVNEALGPIAFRAPPAGRGKRQGCPPAADRAAATARGERGQHGRRDRRRHCCENRIHRNRQSTRPLYPHCNGIRGSGAQARQRRRRQICRGPCAAQNPGIASGREGCFRGRRPLGDRGWLGARGSGPGLEGPAARAARCASTSRRGAKESHRA